jgi:hypothetical protein
MGQDLITVHNAGTIEEADIVVAWLDDHGIKAMVKNRHILGTYSGLGAVSHNQVEVCVIRPEDAERARQLLKEHEESIQRGGDDEEEDEDQEA